MAETFMNYVGIGIGWLVLTSIISMTAQLPVDSAPETAAGDGGEGGGGGGQRAADLVPPVPAPPLHRGVVGGRLARHPGAHQRRGDAGEAQRVRALHVRQAPRPGAGVGHGAVTSAGHQQLAGRVLLVLMGNRYFMLST